MRLMGLMLTLFFCVSGFSVTNLPAVQNLDSAESYLDVSKPKAISYVDRVVDKVSMLKNYVEASEFHYKDQNSENLNKAIGFLTKNLETVLPEIAAEFQKAYENSRSNHNHYYLKQTLEKHSEYIQQLRIAHSYFTDAQKSYSDLFEASQKVVQLLSQNKAPEQLLKQSIYNFAQHLENFKKDLLFLDSKLEASYHTHTYYAALEQQHSFLSLKIGEDRVTELTKRSMQYIRELALGAKTALNSGQENISSKMIQQALGINTSLRAPEGLTASENFELLQEFKKNERPRYNQLMQVIDVEKALSSNEVLIKLETALKSQNQMFNDYLSAIEQNLKLGLLSEKSVEDKFHLSFYKQLETNRSKYVGLNCRVMFN